MKELDPLVKKQIDDILADKKVGDDKEKIAGIVTDILTSPKADLQTIAFGAGLLFLFAYLIRKK
jgi:hypothetical protein